MARPRPAPRPEASARQCRHRSRSGRSCLRLAGKRRDSPPLLRPPSCRATVGLLAHPAAVPSRRKRDAPVQTGNARCRFRLDASRIGRSRQVEERPVMKVGLFINTQFPEGFSLADRVPEMVAQVRAARDAGFSSLWFPHHWLTHPLQMLQITPVMGYVAAHAQGMTIGSNILILPPLNPMHVAEEAATLDVLTGGNFILGVGLGYRQPEFDAFGIPLAERAPRFNEAIGLMRRLWNEDRVTHKGRFYTVNDAGISAKPVRAGGPPLYIASQADGSVRRAARIGDAWLIVNSSGLGKIAPLMQTYRAALKGYGRTAMEFPITVECYVGANHATAHEECRGPLEYKYNAYASWGLQGRRTETTFEDFARDRFIIGDKVSVKEEIAHYHELLGVDHFIMRCNSPSLPQ